MSGAFNSAGIRKNFGKPQSQTLQQKNNRMLSEMDKGLSIAIWTAKTSWTDANQ